jgi:hypothetical protein
VVDECLVSHRPEAAVVDDEVDSLAIRPPADSIDAGDHRQASGARVMRAGRPTADARVQAYGENIDEHLLAPGWLRDRELLVMRRLVKRSHHRGVHVRHGSSLLRAKPDPSLVFGWCHVLI